MNTFKSVQNTLIKKNVVNVLQCFIRNRRTGTASQCQGNKRPEKYFGLKALPGSYCNEREILATQRYLKYHPGLNTAIDPRDNAIYSICEGTIMVTTEKFDSNTENDYVQKFYERRPLESNIYKRYIHVLPLKPKQEFKLINLI